MMRNHLWGLLLYISCFTFLSCCKKEPLPTDTNAAEESPADKIAGIFEGEGKYMPGQIDLGTFEGCIITTGWEKKLKSGTTVTNVIKLTDSTIKISITGSFFGTIILTPGTIKRTGNLIDFQIGHFDIETGFLTLSSFTEKTVYSPECVIGLPYVYGVKVFFTANTYSYRTIDHIEFVGSR